MTIEHVILGYMGWKPLSGYDLKQIIVGSETFEWSAKNNQIYKALINLHKDGFVVKEAQSHLGIPSDHKYRITEAGLCELKRWILTTPEAPGSKKSILNQLIWSDCLSTEELDDLLDRYMNIVGEKLFMLRVQADEKPNMPQRTKREFFLWEMIYRNWIGHYELELRWIRQVRQELTQMSQCL